MSHSTRSSHICSTRKLSGDLPLRARVERMIRVNQAGEYGAMRIYAGQLAVLKNRATAKVIREMAAQEEQHLNTFNTLIAQRRVRPTALMPVWHAAGFALGAATALLGEKAAMACTVAVESVIGEHYARQEAALENVADEQPLKETIAQFRVDEMEHHDTGVEYGAKEAPLYHALNLAIQHGTRGAIWLSTRV